MEHQRLEYLIEQFSNGRITAEELQELNQWYDSVDYGYKSFDKWINDAGGENELVDELFSRFERIPKSRKRITYLRPVYRLTAMAASILLIIAVGVILNNKKKIKLSANNISEKPVVPGSQKAILKLANGEKIILDDQHPGKVASQYGTSIVKNNKGQIVYSNSADSANLTDRLYNTIETPRGGKFSVVLPDGTVAWLNAASTLKYPLRFSKNERRVELTGEAYFEVAHNKDQPFKVISKNQEVRVLGTHFDVKAYEDDDAVSTTLLQGSVLIHNNALNKSKLLVPGQQANLTLNDMQIGEVNVQQVVSWKKGYFLFDHNNIKDIMKLISRWYDVDIRYVDIDQRETFGGTFSEYSDLKEMLQNLQQLGHVHFKLDGRKIIVSK
jgi:ferric-dicitrate binding protein FerR (iron transport regulator)